MFTNNVNKIDTSMLISVVIPVYKIE
ncbi:uncharacterized protein METZ01_LOCUS341837, partial [marine metagenome]